LGLKSRCELAIRAFYVLGQETLSGFLFKLNRNLLDLIKAESVTRLVVELRYALRLVLAHTSIAFGFECVDS
jgi:hypothetical protein